MKIAIMQPYSFPYIGYFQLINAVDTFVFYDDVNFIKKGFINRNSILVNQKKHQFVIACKEISQNKRIDEIQLSFDDRARKKLIKSISMAYRKAPYFEIIHPKIEKFITDDSIKTISDFAINSVVLVSRYLDLKTEFKRSSEDHKQSRKLGTTDRIIAICKTEEASEYLNPIGGVDLYNKSEFKDQGMTLKFLKSQLIPYKQFDHDFVPWLSIIDVLMFNSKEEVRQMLNAFELQ